MSDKLINRLVAIFVFLTTLVVYLKTMSVTVVFWDVGEFCAAAKLMQVPHPPGSPLFLIMAKVSSMIPTFSDTAARMHAVSAVSGAFGIFFLYLTLVRLIGRFYKDFNSVADRIIVYGGSAIGALSLSFSTTYWANSIEAEVYGVAMLLVSINMWLIMRWWDHAEEPHSERYLLLIAYFLGLSTGVHLLGLLSLFPIMTIMYYRLYPINRRTFIYYGIITVISFFLIYPGIVQYLPSMLDGEVGGFKSEIVPFLPLIILIAVGYGAYRSYHSKQRMLHIACLSFLLVFLGYTTYTSVIIRANARPPMNENNPDNLARLVSYLTREQYGETPLLRGASWDNGLQDYRDKLFPRRHSHEPMHEPTRTNYTDDGDFFWKYQTKHMFLRYVGWNFIGAEGDWQDANVSWKDTWGIPFLIGLFGMAFHFWKDRKMFLTMAMMFVIMGFVLAWYQNQQEPQPRERDYFYVGAYYVWSIWVAIGVVGLFQLLRSFLTNKATQLVTASVLFAVSAYAIPGSLLKMNYHEHDRSKNYIAWDYSYNILQSCEPDAILFTNGDNDTFPLWYLQDVEGVRRDIRIVNLSLVNTSWYILQLKNETPHGSKKVPISLSDAAIEQIEPRPWKPTKVDLPVPPDALKKFLSNDRPQLPSWSVDSSVVQQGKISFTISGIPYNNEMRFLRVQDLMIWDIIRANQWQRPVYFAATCSPDSKLGLDDYLWMQGLALKLKPFKVPSQEASLDPAQMEANIMTDNVTPSTSFQSGFMWRNLDNPYVYYDENTQRMVMNYRASFLRMYEYATRVEQNTVKARQVLQRMEKIMPISVIQNMDWRYTAHFMIQFLNVGDTANFNLYSNYVEKKCWELIDEGKVESVDFNPYQILTTVYDGRKDYQKALDVAQRWRSEFDIYLTDPRVKNDPGFQRQLGILNQMIAVYQQNIKGAPATDTTMK